MNPLHTLVFVFLLAIFGTAQAATPTIADCHHDAAPVDTGLYASDMLAGNVVGQAFSVPKGTEVTMTYRSGTQIRSVQCRTSEPRVAYKNKKGEIIDTRCGNEYLKGVSAPAATTASQPPAVAASSPAVAASVPCAGCETVAEEVVRRVMTQVCPGGTNKIPVDQACPDVVLKPVRVVVPAPAVEQMYCNGHVRKYVVGNEVVFDGRSNPTSNFVRLGTEKALRGEGNCDCPHLKAKFQSLQKP